jgi:hypothetical protein
MGELTSGLKSELKSELKFAHFKLDDKRVFDKLFREYGSRASDFTFANLFMWRRMINYRYTWVGGFACIIAIPYKYPPYAYTPIGDMSDSRGFRHAVGAVYDYFLYRGWTPRFRCVTDDITPLITGAVKISKSVLDRDFSDYVYLADSLISLKGKKYDGKRNHINKFKKMYEYEYEKMTSAHVGECYRIMYERCVEKDCGCLKGKFYSCDRKPSMELLENYDQLGCVGGIVKVNGRYEGFTVGDALNKNTAVIYVEKANASIHGLYAFINQQFCEHEWSGMTYVNREEDEGVEGLRKAKLSYHPAFLIEKYTLTR